MARSGRKRYRRTRLGHGAVHNSLAIIINHVRGLPFFVFFAILLGILVQRSDLIAELVDLARDGRTELLDRGERLDIFPLVKCRMARWLVRLVVVRPDVRVGESLFDRDSSRRVKSEELIQQVKS
jgi:hypothetical protein